MGGVKTISIIVAANVKALETTIRLETVNKKYQ